MKTSTKLALLGSAALGVAAWTLPAQDAGPAPDRDRERPQRREDGPPGAGREGRPPMMPLIGALDLNHDGVIDADEIKHASAALLKLDKDGDGKLSREEFLTRQFAVAIFVQLQQRCRGVFDFVSVNDAVVI